MTGRTSPYDISHIRSYPTILQIYRIPASPFWQVRLWTGRKYVRKTTKCKEKGSASEFAKLFYDEYRMAERLDETIHTDTFSACAQKMVAHQEALIKRGVRDGRLNTEDKKKLDKDILPYFQTMAVGKINTIVIEEYLDSLVADRDLSPSTQSKHIVVIRKVLKEALKREFIKHLPQFPTISQKDKPRPYFEDEEYDLLKKTARKLAKEGPKVRYVPLTEEIADFIVFHTNVYVRPSDIKILRHRDVKVIKVEGSTALSIIPPHSKTVTRESLSMPAAVGIYKRLKQRQSEKGMGKKDDYVFFPQYPNREYAWQTIQRQFNFILKEAGIKKTSDGRLRTVYSLRHTAIMYRLLKSDNIDIFLLAKNALTSVSQLERFYLSHAESRMKIENLQSVK